eukprot:516648-Heterocapsa_arctica.AAC.1
MLGMATCRTAKTLAAHRGHRLLDGILGPAMPGARAQWPGPFKPSSPYSTLAWYIGSIRDRPYRSVPELAHLRPIVL